MSIIAFIALVVAMIVWPIMCGPAKADSSWVTQGNAELLDPQGFYQPYSQVQVGRNATENLIHATSYTIPPACGYEDVTNCMIEFHAQRVAWFILYNGGPLISHDLAVLIVVTAMRYGIDYRICIATLLFESTFGLGSSNLYGFAHGNSGSWAKQTEDYFSTVAGYGFGNNPAAIYGYYNCWKPEYIRNCMEIYRGCDGGDLQ